MPELETRLRVRADRKVDTKGLQTALADIGIPSTIDLIRPNPLARHREGLVHAVEAARIYLTFKAADVVFG